MTHPWIAAHTKDFPSEVATWIDNHARAIESAGLRRVYATHEAFYYANARGTGFSLDGSHDQEVDVNINDFGTSVRQLVSLVTEQRINYECLASSGHYTASTATRLSRQVLDYYTYQGGISQAFFEAVLSAFLYGEAFISVLWDDAAGPVVQMTESGHAIHAGEVIIRPHHPIDIVRDPAVKAWSDTRWVYVRDKANRHELAAIYPEHKGRILDLPQWQRRQAWAISEYGDDNFFSGVSTDFVEVWRFRHLPTAALPTGRDTIICGGVALFDGPLPEGRLGVERVAAEESTRHGYGHSLVCDLSGPQEGINELYSIAMTNLAAFGRQHVLVPTGSEINVEELGESLSAIYYNAMAGGKPEGLTLVQQPDGLGATLDRLSKAMQDISGINSTLRGDPERRMSGSALSLLTARAIAYVSHMSNSYAAAVTGIARSVLAELKANADDERMIALLGPVGDAELIRFRGSDLDGVAAVHCQLAPPELSTAGGRQQVASELLVNQMITPEQYFNVLQTGRLPEVLKSADAQTQLHRWENEQMANGKEAPVLQSDMHEAHMLAHAEALASPDMRMDHEKRSRFEAHIAEHAAMMAPPPGAEGAPGMEGSEGLPMEGDPALAAQIDPGALNTPDSLDNMPAGADLPATAI